MSFVTKVSLRAANFLKISNLLLLLACFFLSGLAGLIYQTVWLQQLALVFGTSELALATVLAAYMGGLAIGAWLAARWTQHIRKPVLIYALLELGIGGAALLVPFAIQATGSLLVHLLGSAELPSGDNSVLLALFYLVSSGAVLLVPTALMGATLPLLARHAVRRDSEIGLRIGLLYTANTVGAATGTLATAFLLLPRIGLGATIWVAASVNLLVFFVALLLARGAAEQTPVVDDPMPLPSRAVPWILPAILISGSVSFTWEILWTRLLTPLLGGSIYAFSIMLASFLVAIALGSAAVGPLATTPHRAEKAFAWAQMLIGGFSLISFVSVRYLPDLVQHWSPPPGQKSGPGDSVLFEGALSGSVLTSNLGIGSFLGFVLLLPAGLAIGATFPLAVRILARSSREAASASARVLAWNTTGAILGALLTGYFLLPGLRFAGTAQVAAGVSFLLAAGTAFAVRPRCNFLGWSGVAAILGLLICGPSPPWPMLRHSPLIARAPDGAIIHYAVGQSSTVLLTEHLGQWRLTTNGLPESSVESPGYRPGRHVVARWLGLLPIALRPETESLLAVGLGAGVTVEDLPSSLSEIHVIELEPEVILANQRLSHERRQDPLLDPRLELHLGDARGILRLTQRKFGAIVSQPSHPWTSGASNLYTREFFTLARDHLQTGGIFCQWMGLHFVDEPLLRSLLRTAADVFDFVEVYQPLSGAIVIVGSMQPLDLTTTADLALAGAKREWRDLGVSNREDLLIARLLNNRLVRSLSEGAQPITDSRNLLRMGSPWVSRGSTAAFSSVVTSVPLLQQGSVDIDPVYAVRRLIRQGSTQRAWRLANSLNDQVNRQAATAWVQLARGERRQANQSTHRALRIDSYHAEARAAWLELSKSSLTRGLPVAQFGDLTTEQVAIIEGWRLAQAGDWTGTGNLEEVLRGIEPRDPLFRSATRIRVRWRLATGNEPLAREALDLLLPILGPLPQPRDLILRARAAAVLGESKIVLASITDLAQLTPTGLRPDIRGEVQAILNSLPLDEKTHTWREELLRLIQ